jgi:tRNA-2-methylthio-N6-dimethylallyladenosine synthase
MPGRTVYLETFGCQMNELDSELVTGQLRALGYAMTPERERADVVLYNTCSVREHAEQKVWSRLGEDQLRKLVSPSMVVGVIGCMAERDGQSLIKRMPVVDILCGPGELDKLPGLIDNAVKTRESLFTDAGGDEPPTEIATPEFDDRGRIILNDHEARRRLSSASQVALQGNTSRRSATLAAAQDTLELLDLSRSVSADEHSGSAYVRITRGCNKFCTYCVVPFTRGAEVHRPPKHIVEECKRLADTGVIEITLLGQTVNHYRFEHGAAVSVGGIVQPQKGRSYAGGNGAHRADPFRGAGVTTFADLLALIHEKVPAIQRLRFVTSYPRDFGDDVLQVIRDHPRICRYLHVPAQSGSDRILGLMNRGYTVSEYLEFLDRARSFLHQPEIGRPLTVAGDIIVGFPTETEEDHEATKRLLERSRYKNCFIFKYSPRPGTIAIDKFEDDVPEEVKKQRNAELLALQHRMSAEVSGEFIGQTLNVFVSGVSKKQRKSGTSSINASEAPHHHNRHHTNAAPGAVSLTLGGKALTPGASCAPTADSSLTVDTETATDEDASAPGPIQMSARTEGDVIVFFDLPDGASPDDFIGRVVSVLVDRAEPLALHGRTVLRV